MTAEAPRTFHEAKGRIALFLLRRSPDGLTKHDYERHIVKGGTRLAPAIDMLRNAHGFNISGDGSKGPKDGDPRPYKLEDRRQRPTLVAVEDKHKIAYWETDHWKTLKAKRKELDYGACVSCRSTENLQCHHIRYNLFAENITELLTVCEEHHEIMHSSARLAFPSGMLPEHVRRMGLEPEYQWWLSPDWQPSSDFMENIRPLFNNEPGVTRIDKGPYTGFLVQTDFL